MILFVSNADTELLALRSVVDDLTPEVGPIRWFHPDRAGGEVSLDGVHLLDGVNIVVVRLLGGADAWAEPFAALRAGCVHRARCSTGRGWRRG